MRKILKQIAPKVAFGAIFLTAIMPNSVQAEDCALWVLNCKTNIEYAIVKKSLGKTLDKTCKDVSDRAFTDKKDREELDAVCHRTWTKIKDSEDKPSTFCKFMSLALVKYNKCPN